MRVRAGLFLQSLFCARVALREIILHCHVSHSLLYTRHCTETTGHTRPARDQSLSLCESKKYYQLLH